MASIRLAMIVGAWLASGVGACSPGTGSAGAGSGPGAGGFAAGAGGVGGGSGFAASGAAPGASGAASGGTGGDPIFGTGGGGASSGGATAGTGGAGTTDGGNPACSPPDDVAVPETCDGLDNDLDGFIDEQGCQCNAGATQECFDGPPSQATAPNCHKGTQACVQSGEFGQWGPCEGSGCGALVLEEQCDNGVDDDCDGATDEGCTLDAEVNLDGDCLSAFCPPQAPNPIGCEITMEGGDSRGCISHLSGSAEVYFQEGNACPTCLPIIGCTGGAGRVYGKLRCSSDPTPVPLDATNCVINKAEPAYTTPSATPITQPVSGCAQ